MTRFVVELGQTETGAVEGTVTLEGSDELRSFSGWLELLRLLETADAKYRDHHNPAE